MNYSQTFIAVTIGISVLAAQRLNAADSDQRPAQSGEGSTAFYDPGTHDRNDWWGDQDGFLNAQARRTLDLVDRALIQHPPQLPEPLERKMALYMIDGVLHDVEAPKRPPVQEFLRMRIERALKEIETTQVNQGAMIWRLYNETFIVRTKTVTLAFDLVRGRLRNADGFGLPDELLEKIVDQCDVLFISHRHRDHADDRVAEFFLDQGKPVVAPPEVWAGKPIHERITHLKRVAHTIQKLPVQNGEKELRVVNYPGHQGGSIENNVPLVFTPEGMSFAQTGDQSNDSDFSWIDEVAANHKVDVLMPNCWTTDIVRMAKGFKPRVIIPGHQNEMGHTIDHREPHWLTYNRLSRSPYPIVPMSWGEKFRYER